MGLCAALAGLTGCGGGSEDTGGGSTAGFDVSLTMRGTNGAETSSFSFGNNIVFDLHVTNRSGGSQVLSLPTSQVYDLAVFAPGSQTPLWRWSFNRSFSPVANNIEFRSHQAITYLYIWPGVLEDGTQIMPGTYEVRGTLAYAQYSADWRSDDELAAPIKRITITN
jgi:Intracellular proteinase inhibitor